MTRIKKILLIAVVIMLCALVFTACNNKDNDSDTYTITLDKQEGTGGSDSVTVTMDTDMPEATAPSKIGYTFEGYYDALTGGTQYYSADMTSAKAWDKAEDATLYAKWTANAYTVTLNKQDGMGGSDSIQATYGKAMPSATAPTKTDYTFGGYFSQPDGSGEKYYNADMTSAKAWDKTSNTTLYAIWTENTYTVTLDKQEGSSGSDSVQAAYGKAMPSATAPLKEGYTFSGYFSQPDGAGEKYYNADMTSAKTWNIADNTTLYAFWKEPALWNAIGKGTSLEPYLINDIEQLGSLAAQTQNKFSGIYFNLGNSIDLGSKEWIPIGSASYPFEGYFDGKGHTISKFKITASITFAGLFGYNSGTILNLGAENFIINSKSLYAGGLVGRNYGTIINSYATGNANVTPLTNFVDVGGLVGNNYGTIENSHATVNVVAKNTSPWISAGGLVGYNSKQSVIVNSYATGDVNAQTTITDDPDGYYVDAGGLVGFSWGTITNCYAIGNVTTSSYSQAGGLIGRNDGTITNSYATGDVIATANTADVGGLVGFNHSYSGIITNCYRYGGQTIKINGVLDSTNTEGTVCTITDLNSALFYTDTLGWDDDIWDFAALDFENVKYPTLK